MKALARCGEVDSKAEREILAIAVVSLAPVPSAAGIVLVDADVVVAAAGDVVVRFSTRVGRSIQVEL
jgi:hypothetical protein